jgi:FkbM family methyltransferase
MYNKCDDHIPDYFFYNIPFHEDIILRLVKLFSKKSACIADIGANTGFHTVIAALANPNCKIFSVEPYAPNYQRLQKNINLNKCANVTIVKHALGKEYGQLKFFVPSDNSITDVSSVLDTHGNRIYPEAEWKETTVSVITFDRLYEQTGKIDFFKCDAEGFETEVLNGAELFFSNYKPSFIIEICLDEEKCAYFNEFARKNGYNMYLVTNDGLYYMESLYNFDRWPNFLFTTYKDEYPFIPVKKIEQFLENCTKG